MIICKDGCYAYTGATAAAAYDSYLNSSDAHDSLGPDELAWYSATEMTLSMTLAAKPKATPAKPTVKK